MPSSDDDELIASGAEIALRPDSVARRAVAGLRSTFGAFAKIVWEMRVLLGLAIGYIVAVEVLLWAMTDTLDNGLSGFGNVGGFMVQHIVAFILYRIAPFLQLTVAVAAVWLLYNHVWLKTDPRPLSAKIVDLLQPLARLDPWARMIVFCAVYIPFMGTFVAFKATIVEIQPFAWDPAFAALDRAIHGGIAPWRITWALFDAPWVTRVIDGIYGSWFVIIYSVPLAVLMFDINRQRRSQFLITHILLWVLLGSGAALLFSSAGPCFFEGVTGQPGDFAPLMQNLGAVDRSEPLIALKLQNLLWDSYQGLRSRVEGISAMPSLHIAQVVLLALAAHRYSRKLAWVAWGYAFLIFLGSVHLGWHYAVDGYAAAALTVAIWWAVGRFMVRRA